MISVYVAFISVCILFILLAHVRTKPMSFYLGSEQYGPLISGASIVAAFTGGGAILNTTSLAAKYGDWAFFDVFPSVIGLLLAALFVKIKFFGKTFSTSFFNVDSALYDRKAIIVHYAQIAFLYTLVIAAQLRAVATVASQIDIPISLAVAVCCVTVAAYAFRGFDAVTRTDIAQLLLMLPMYVIIAFIAFETTPTGTNNPPPHVEMPISLAIALCLPAFFLPISQEIHQRGAAAANERTVGLSYLLAGMLYLGLASFLVLSFTHTPTLNFFTIITGTNPVAAVLVAIGILAAILSTLDTSTNIASHAVQQLPVVGKLPPAGLQASLLAIGSILFLFFPTILSLILFALFVYMSGPALSFVAVYNGVHPKQSAIIGGFFVTLQAIGQFKHTLFTQLPYMPKSVRDMDNIQIGLGFLLLQILILIIIRLHRRFT